MTIWTKHPLPPFNDRPLQLWVSIVVLILMSSACDPAPSLYAVGVRRSADGAGMEALFFACPGRPLQSLSVFRDPESVVGDEGDDLVWRVDGTMSGLATIELGVTPAGFDEEVPLTIDLRAASQIGISIMADGGETVVEFSPSDLQGTQVYRGSGEYQTERAFLQDVSARC